MNSGVMYISWGESHRDELRRSIYTLRQHSELPVVVAADEMFDIDAEVVVVDGLTRKLLNKDIMYDVSPFDVTLFLDTDTCVFSPIQHILDRAEQHGIAVAMAPQTNLATYCFRCNEMTGDLSKPVVFNTGVIGFSRTPDVEKVFSMWKNLNERTPLACDQPGFAVAIDQLDFNPWVLPKCWNFRPGHRNLPADVIRIWHDRNIWLAHYS